MHGNGHFQKYNSLEKTIIIPQGIFIDETLTILMTIYLQSDYLLVIYYS